MVSSSRAIVVILLFVFYSISAEYSTNFTSLDSNYWSFETDCNHCSHDNGIECTQYAIDSVQFGSVSNKSGVTITTIPLPKATSCGGICQSGHLGFKPGIKFGKYQIKSRWFPSDSNKDKTGEGYIGMDGDDNNDSIYFGFDGGTNHSFKTTSYTNGPGHGEQNINEPNLNIDTDFQIYELEWLPDSVKWSLNGNVVRTVTDKSQIPQIELKLAIHSRSSNCPKMKSGTSLYSQHLYFTYWNETELIAYNSNHK
eukprot:292800_1